MYQRYAEARGWRWEVIEEQAAQLRQEEKSHSHQGRRLRRQSHQVQVKRRRNRPLHHLEKRKKVEEKKEGERNTV